MSSPREGLVNNFWMPLKKYGELGRDKIISLCNYSFAKLKKRSLACRERGTLQTRFTLLSIVWLSVQPQSIELIPIQHSETCWPALWVWATGTFISTKLNGMKTNLVQICIDWSASKIVSVDLIRFPRWLPCLCNFWFPNNIFWYLILLIFLNNI